MEYRTINNGVKMPMLGFGVFQISDPKICEESVLTAIRHGYRRRLWERGRRGGSHP